MSNPIELTRHVCPALAVSLGLGGLAIILVLAMEIGPTPWTLLTCGLVAVTVWWAIWNQALLRSPGAIIRLRVHHDQLLAFCRNGDDMPVTIAGSSRLFARVALLKLRRLDAIDNRNTGFDGTGCRALSQVLILDLPLCRNVNTEAFRRLRVWVRFSSATG